MKALIAGIATLFLVFSALLFLNQNPKNESLIVDSASSRTASNSAQPIPNEMS
jgi:hypothetical protein